ncbi:MAG TPA: hypothetical protein VN841_21950 [Bryobacteraceae bacterium]|nr:hypothetical protein [Bryobacteraceae bacterium]
MPIRRHGFNQQQSFQQLSTVASLGGADADGDNDGSGSSSASSGASSGSNAGSGTSGGSTSSSSQTASQLFAGFLTNGDPNQATFPAGIILTTLANAGLTGA